MHGFGRWVVVLLVRVENVPDIALRGFDHPARACAVGTATRL